MNITIIISVLIGVALGVLLFALGLYFYMRFDENRYKKQFAIEKLHKEIEVRRTLNLKIIELLNRPIYESDYDLIDPREDVKIPFADYQFLKNYASLHSLYIPIFFLDQFFKNISSHLAVFDDAEDLKNGGYIFKDSRRIFEDFSVTITDEMEEKQKQLTEAKNIYPTLLKKQYFEV